jgi:hypothetical protein
MKACLDCGTTVENHQTFCPVCNIQTAWRIVGNDDGEGPAGLGSGTAPSSLWYPSAVRSRPDGFVPKLIGSCLIAFAVIFAAIAAGMSVTTYSFITSAAEIDPDKLQTKAILTLLSEGFFGLGLVLWLAGYIVHAISFLPTKGDLVSLTRSETE